MYSFLHKIIVAMNILFYKVKTNIFAVCKWLFLASITGILCGLVGSCFDIMVEKVTHIRGSNPIFLCALPFAGLLIVWIYKKFDTENKGTNAVIDQVKKGEGLPLLLLPSIFIGTVLTHLCGGSAGREGAALQMGGTIGYHAGKWFHLDDKDMRTLTLTGMASFFSALFGTPVAATIFSIMVVSVGVFYHANLLPCLIGSLVSLGVSLLFGIEPTRFTVTIPNLEWILLIKVALLACACALVAVIFIRILHCTEKLFKKIENSYIRVFVGGILILLLTLCIQTDSYNGAGMNIITKAVEEGVAMPWDFLMKMLFTAITLASGFKGGEVVPTFFVGATFGCTFAPLLGIDPGFGASLGLVALFCGVTNCPIASTILAIELFGGEGIVYYALCCSLCYILSGYSGLYTSQTILYSKTKAQFIANKNPGSNAS